jgi:hypothetical protein
VRLVSADSCNLWIVLESGERRARQRAPRRGSRVKISVERDALRLGTVYLLCRKGKGDVIVAASAFAERLEGVRARLGNEYDVQLARVVE